MGGPYKNDQYASKTVRVRVMFRVENGQYGHASIRSDTSIRVYTTADTDTVLRALVSQPLVILD